MDPYMSVLFMLTISFPEAMILVYMAFQLMGHKPKAMEIVAIGFMQAILAFFIRTLPLPVGLHTILQILTYVVLMGFISRVSYWVASIGIIISVSIYLLQEIAVTQIILSFANLSLEAVMADSYMRIYFFIPSALVMIGLILLIKKYNISFIRLIGWKGLYGTRRLTFDEEPLFYKQYLPSVIFIFLPVLLLFVLNFAYITADEQGSEAFKILRNGLIVGLGLVSVWTLKKISKAIEKEYEAKKAAETVEQLKELIKSNRKQRHDFNHHLQTVYGLIQIKNYAGASEYIQNTYHYVSGTGELIKTDNVNIGALLYTKLLIAETNNVRFDINLECSLADFPLKNNEASSLLGNLIDNAMDEAIKQPSDKKFMSLFIDEVRGNYQIEISNTGEIDESVKQNMFNLNFSTKEGHSGIGLAIVKEIADKYNGAIDVVSGEGRTLFRISIPVRR